MLKYKLPMSLRPEREKESYSRSDYTRKAEPDNTGGEIDVTRYSDGSSSVHFGGPAGKVDFDKFGNQC